MSDRHAVALAVAAMVGAWWSAAVPLLPAVALALVALAVRKPWLLVAAVMLLSSSLGARAWAGLDPVEPAAFDGEATLVADPVPVGEGMRVSVRAEGRRYEAWAYGRAARDLRERLAGDRITVTGSVRPILPLPDYQAAPPHRQPAEHRPHPRPSRRVAALSAGQLVAPHHRLRC